ncbi:hypothetical protein RchiOBHm_Chr3g0484151 [Rosa chinensis]|uniref:Uncharacterized protein n=1 Tax=Rosa chinensis TaxID=74649 RepID=A0A2P6REN3_ROSCH|nr:hypothetical protein RchiOBHm_Chr3g0484151 [Rosa chinensis]
MACFRGGDSAEALTAVPHVDCGFETRPFMNDHLFQCLEIAAYKIALRLRPFMKDRICLNASDKETCRRLFVNNLFQFIRESFEH